MLPGGNLVCVYVQYMYICKKGCMAMLIELAFIVEDYMHNTGKHKLEIG